MESLENNNSSIIFFLNSTENIGNEFGNSATERKLSIVKAIFQIISITGIIGNVITILALSKSKRIRNATTILISNLCAADMLYCFFTFINFVFPGLHRNPAYCQWFPFARFFVAGESVYMMVAITINRYICVLHSSIYSSVYQPKFLILIILTTWLFAFSFPLFPFFEVWGKFGYDSAVGVCSVLKLKEKSPVNFFFVLAFSLPTTTFAICFPRILWTVHKASKRTRRFETCPLPEVVKDNTTVDVLTPSSTENVPNGTLNEKIQPSSMSAKQYRKELRVLRVMLVVVIGFMICYFPVAFIKIFKKEKELPTFLVISYLGYNLSNVINPIIYVIMSSEYRIAYKELFRCKNLSFGNSSSSGLISA